MFRSLKEVAHRSVALLARQATIVAGVTGVVASSASHATGVDLSSLTGAVDFSTVCAAILLVAAGVAVVNLTIAGAKTILAAIKRA